MTRFSANLGFLWTDRSLPDAIRAARRAGFSAVECHWPYDTPAEEVAAALKETGLPMLGLNTRRGDVAAKENGLSALPGREEEARSVIREALTYAQAIKAGAVHVMAGNAEGPEAHQTFLANLRFALAQPEAKNRLVLIEPLNRHDAPGYFLRTTDQARSIIEDIGAANLKLMFDCYHVGRTEGDVTTRMRDLLPIIGHIQFASVPERAAPDRGELNYQVIFAAIDALGWMKPVGAEYKPGRDTDATLGWLETYG